MNLWVRECKIFTQNSKSTKKTIEDYTLGQFNEPLSDLFAIYYETILLA